MRPRRKLTWGDGLVPVGAWALASLPGAGAGVGWLGPWLGRGAGA